MEGDDDDDDHEPVVAAVAALLCVLEESDSSDEESDKRAPHQARFRIRRSIRSIFNEYGPYYVRRAYRMNEASFWQLHDLLKPYMGSLRCKPNGKKKKHKNGGKNGLITTETRLSAAIRYFAGGRPDDISISHGIAHSEVFYSCWVVVDAVNKCPDLDISYPVCHDKQRDLAKAFFDKSAAGIGCCAGATDGMLLWIEKPSLAECELAECAAKKFFCGRKHKYGLNMQGTCDADGKFLDVSVGHPGSTSDFLAFSTSKFHKLVEQPGFMAPGLCIFGDLAYVNNSYFMTPFKSIKSGPKDSFNFYHSQLRINIECAFGMFVGRWGILRRALPKTMGLKKTIALVFCLCRLHNFCIDHRGTTLRICAPLPADSAEIIANGGLQMEGAEGPEELLHGGEHNDDHSKRYRQEFGRTGHGDRDALRDSVLRHIEKHGFERPTPKAWVQLGVPE